MAEYEITAVADGVRDWRSKAAPASDPEVKDMRSYRVDLKKPDGSIQPRVELAQKQTTGAPTVGQKLTGEITERQWGDNNEKTDYKFKKESRGGGGGGGRAWKPRPDDAPPVWAGKQAQIVAQHSQNMALRVLELASSRVPTGEASDDTLVRQVNRIMEQLGVKTTVAKERCPGCGQLTEAEADGAEVDTIDLGLVDAFSLHANEAFERAWAREARANTVKTAMGEAA